MNYNKRFSYFIILLLSLLSGHPSTITYERVVLLSFMPILILLFPRKRREKKHTYTWDENTKTMSIRDVIRWSSSMLKCDTYSFLILWAHESKMKHTENTRKKKSRNKNTNWTEKNTVLLLNQFNRSCNVLDHSYCCCSNMNNENNLTYKTDAEIESYFFSATEC